MLPAAKTLPKTKKVTNVALSGTVGSRKPSAPKIIPVALSGTGGGGGRDNSDGLAHAVAVPVGSSSSSSVTAGAADIGKSVALSGIDDPMSGSTTVRKSRRAEDILDELLLKVGKKNKNEKDKAPAALPATGSKLAALSGESEVKGTGTATPTPDLVAPSGMSNGRGEARSSNAANGSANLSEVPQTLKEILY